MTTVCPLECLREDSWLEKHESFVLTLTASLSALLGMLLSYCLKSRCTSIRCCGLSCERIPLDNVNSNENLNVSEV